MCLRVDLDETYRISCVYDTNNLDQQCIKFGQLVPRYGSRQTDKLKTISLQFCQGYQNINNLLAKNLSLA